MSTLKATNLQNAGSALININLDTNGNVNVAGTVSMGSSFLRNRLINGDMRIDARNNGAAVTVNTSPVFPVDRFYCSANASGVFTAQRNTTVPAGAGFTNSVLLTVTTARSSIAATDVYGIRQNIEGLNLADLMWGSASAQPITLSFWVRSSIPGTYAVAFFNSAFDRSYVATYAINAANTWERKVITIVGDTTGTWLTDTGIGMSVLWDLGSGSNYNGTAGAWAAAGRIRTSATTNWISTLGATFYLTGAQFEVGTDDTAFERRPYGTELFLAQRYYWKTQSDYRLEGQNGYGNSTWGFLNNPAPMRVAPTVSNTWYNGTSASCAINFINIYGFQPTVTPTAGNYYGATYQAGNTVSAELV